MGFVRFLHGYYMILITERRKVMQIGKHYVYKIEATMMIPVFDTKRGQSHDPLEARYLKAFQNVDMSSNFYFSYTYDLTRPLQANMHIPTPTQAARREPPRPQKIEPLDDFVWNSFFTEPYVHEVHDLWKINVVHGFATQQVLHVFGRQIFVALIARRSREFAGTRFLKRGATAAGKPANYVETEQIAFDATDLDHLSGRYTSFLQIRASVPCYWSQDISTKIKPPIQIDRRDPFASAAALHFDEVIQKYGFPLIVLNLVKKKEKRKREAILSEEFTASIDYLNQFLSDSEKIDHTPWDMHRTAKSKDGNVLQTLSEIGKRAMMRTGFFHAGPELYCNRLRGDDSAPLIGGIGYDDTDTPGRNQQGIVRVNCVDCLDRTNTAQFMFGLNALGNQLYALGILEDPDQLTFDCAAFHMLEEMFEDHGDTLALQYGGSNLVNRIQTYRKTSPWTVGSRDILNTVSRYYSNSFTDAEKQEAINVFLGKFRPAEHKENIWELESDHILHYPHMKTGHFGAEPIADYTKWCNLSEGSPAQIAVFRCSDHVVDGMNGADRHRLKSRDVDPATRPVVKQTDANELAGHGLAAGSDCENDDMEDMSPALLAVLNPGPESRKSAVLRPLPSLSIFRCCDIVQLKQRVLEFYKVGSGIKNKSELKFDAPSPGTIESIANLVSFLAGESAVSLEAVAKATPVSVLATLMIELSGDKRIFSWPIYGAVRMDYVRVRELIADELGLTTPNNFDKEVIAMVANWKVKSKNKEDFGIAALLIAGRYGYHFRPSTIIPTPPLRPRVRRCGDAMFNEFYEVGCLTSFDDDRTFTLQIAAAGRAAGNDTLSSFSPSRNAVEVGPDVSKERIPGASPGVAESNLFQKSPFGIPREEDVDSDQDEFEETLNPGLFFNTEDGSTVNKAVAADTVVIRDESELAELPSAEEYYGVGLARLSEVDIAVFGRFTNLDGFLEGEDYLVPPISSPSLHENDADIAQVMEGFTIVERPMHISTPAKRDHKPVTWRTTIPRAPSVGPSFFSSDAGSLKRNQPHYPTAFSAVSSKNESVYEGFVASLNAENRLPRAVADDD
mmetsp:Transcript_3378/g.8350  ORF Transcript_3378/g.8350 Transcript_3378/m.8350 type:complete len:1071 (+) Transcript_3378:2-3214(+)